MDIISNNIFWILVVSGVLTSTMLAAAVAPETVFRQFFGDTLPGPLGNAIMRNWGLIIGVSGLLLIYVAFEEAARTPIILFSIIGKAYFAYLVFAGGKTLSAARGGAVIDLAIVGLLIAYLAGL